MISCPACGHDEALVELGARRERSSRWRPWLVTSTRLYLCARCDALVAARSGRDPIVESLPPRGEHNAPALTLTQVRAR